MFVLGINRVLEWAQVTAGGRNYTCRTREIGGKLFFRFKKHWYHAVDFTSELTTELVSKDGEIVSRMLKK